MTLPSSRRASQRFPVDFDVEIGLGERSLHTRALNLSVGGLFIALDDKTTLGERVHLRFSLGSHVISCDALVRWHGDHGAGLSFDGLRARDVYAVGKFIESLT